MKHRKIVHVLTSSVCYCGHTFRGTYCGKTLLLMTPVTADPAQATCKACLDRVALLEVHPHLAERIDEMASTPEGQVALGRLLGKPRVAMRDAEIGEVLGKPGQGMSYVENFKSMGLLPKK